MKDPRATRTQLPQCAWPLVRLADVCDIQLGKMLSPASKQGVRSRQYLRNANVQWGRFDLGDIAEMDFTEEQEAKFRLRTGDVMVCEGGEPGRAAVWRGDIKGCLYQKSLHRIRPNLDVLDSDYLAYRLRHAAFRSEFTGSHAKTTIAHLPAVRLAELRIELPPLPEQKRIAAALREQLDAVARMRTAAERQLAVADGLAKKKLDALFKESQLQSWPEVSLPEIADIVAGVTLGRGLEAGEVRMIAYLRVANVKDGHLDLSDLTETPATEVEIARLKLCDGDLVLTEGGDPDKLGRGTIWSNQVSECIHQNHIFRVRLNREAANPVFVSAQFGSAYGKAYFARHAKQTTGIASINQRVLKAFPLKLPPLPVQESIAQEHEVLVVWQGRLGETVRKTQELVGRLPAALLRRAFSGDSPDN